MRVADRHDELADAQRGGVAERGGRGRGLLRAEHGEVGERVRADHPERQLAAVGERRADAVEAALRRRART